MNWIVLHWTILNWIVLGWIIFNCIAEYDTIQYDFQLNTIKLWYNYNTIMMQSNPITIHYYDTTWIVLLDHIGFLGLIINDQSDLFDRIRSDFIEIKFNLINHL